jgi:hypothetical protein
VAAAPRASRVNGRFGLATYPMGPYFAVMAHEYAGGFYVVAATKDGKTEYWAAATLREHAVDEVRKELGPGWNASFTERRIATETMRDLKMQRLSVRKLPPGIRFL